MPCCYTNKKGKVIEVTVSDHAMYRYIERLSKMHGGRITADQAMVLIEHSFNRAERTLTSSYRYRLRRYKGDSLYFKADGFVFVVENGTMVTVEIASKNKRYLN